MGGIMREESPEFITITTRKRAMQTFRIAAETAGIETDAWPSLSSFRSYLVHIAMSMAEVEGFAFEGK